MDPMQVAIPHFPMARRKMNRAQNANDGLTGRPHWRERSAAKG